MGPQHFFLVIFPDRSAYIPSPLGEKKVQPRKFLRCGIPKSKIRILGGIYGEKPAPQADFFFLGGGGGGGFFFPPPENLIFGLFAYHPDQWCTKFWLLT